jgi:hypothetical protein
MRVGGSNKLSFKGRLCLHLQWMDNDGDWFELGEFTVCLNQLMRPSAPKNFIQQSLILFMQCPVKKGKGKVRPGTDHEGTDLGAGWGGWLTPRLDRFTSGKETRYPLYRSLGGYQGRSGRVRKISSLPGLDPRTVQSVASRYTEYANPASALSKVRGIKDKWTLERRKLNGY